MPGRPYQRAFGALKRSLLQALKKPPKLGNPCRRSSTGLDLGALTAAPSSQASAEGSLSAPESGGPKVHPKGPSGARQQQ
ncbi:hypothetical protein VTN00DRAFT_7811 [Thermoascus crustaceus]|uniref:uncharacterized protein n=1 Tax=Thermoascus crustaceus TaxID=5088 RepID=UPI003742376B